MGRYTIYYSTRPLIDKYQNYMDNPDNYNEFNKPDEPVKIRLISNEVRNEILAELDERLARHEISKEEHERLFLEERNKHLEEKFNKYEIDSFFSCFKSEEDCLKALCHPSSMCHEDIIRTRKNGRQNRIIIQYRYRGRNRELPVVYNNPTFQKIAFQFAKRRANGETPQELNLTPDIQEEYYAYIENIVEEYLKDRRYNRELADLFRRTAEHSELYRGLVRDIESFYTHTEARQEHLDRGDDSELDEINREIENCSNNFKRVFKRYDILRVVALWEQNISIRLRKKKEEEKAVEKAEEYTQTELDIDKLFKKDPSKAQEEEEKLIKKKLIDEIKNIAKLAEEEAKKKGNSLTAGPRRELLKKFNSRELNFMSQDFLDKYNISIEKLEEKEKREERKELREDRETIKDHENDKIYNLASEGKTEGEKYANVIEHMDLDEMATNYPNEVLADVGVLPDGLGLDKNGEPIKNGNTK